MDFEPLRAYLNRLTDWIIPGNAISVWKDGKEVFVGQSGYADVETKELMTADHWINIYSTSKVTTVTAALQLLEQGYFLLEDPVWAYLPAYRELQVRWPDGSVRKAEKTMTMRHLFTMTSGLDYNCGGPAIEKARALTGGAMDTVTVANCLAGEPLSFEPGTHWQYSLSHDVLAAVVEVISGKRFRDYVRENLFEPLGIEKAVYHNEPVRDRMAQQYNYAVEAETDPVELQRSSRNEHGRLENGARAWSISFSDRNTTAAAPGLPPPSGNMPDWRRRWRGTAWAPAGSGSSPRVPWSCCGPISWTRSRCGTSTGRR